MVNIKSKSSNRFSKKKGIVTDPFKIFNFGSGINFYVTETLFNALKDMQHRETDGSVPLLKDSSTNKITDDNESFLEKETLISNLKMELAKKDIEIANLNSDAQKAAILIQNQSIKIKNDEKLISDLEKLKRQLSDNLDAEKKNVNDLTQLLNTQMARSKQLEKDSKEYLDIITFNHSLSGYAQKVKLVFDISEQIEEAFLALSNCYSKMTDNTLYYIVKFISKYANSIKNFDRVDWRENFELLASTGLVKNKSLISGAVNGATGLNNDPQCLANLQQYFYNAGFSEYCSAILIFCSEISVMKSYDSAFKGDVSNFSKLREKLMAAIIALGYQVLDVEPFESISSVSNVESIGFKEVDNCNSGIILEVIHIAVLYGHRKDITKVITQK